MTDKYLKIRTCGECPFIIDDDETGDICGVDGMAVGGLMSPPPICPIDDMNNRRQDIPMARNIQCVVCKYFDSSWEPKPFKDWIIIKDNHGSVVIDYPDKSWHWIGICPECLRRIHNDI